MLNKFVKREESEMLSPRAQGKAARKKIATVRRIDATLEKIDKRLEKAGFGKTRKPRLKRLVQQKGEVYISYLARVARELLENEKRGNTLRYASKYGPATLCISEALEILGTIESVRNDRELVSRAVSDTILALETGLRNESLAHKGDAKRVEAIKQIYADGLEAVRLHYKDQHKRQKKKLRVLDLNF